jgi:hypothetical protein
MLDAIPKKLNLKSVDDLRLEEKAMWIASSVFLGRPE